MTARELTEALGGKWRSRYGTAKCPAHKNRHPNLTIRDGESAPLLSCKTGCPTDTVIAALKSLGLWGSRDTAKVVTWRAPAAKPKPSPTVYWHTRDAPRETQRACDIWREACGSFGADTPAGRYLIGRGIPPPWPETLAFGCLTTPRPASATSPLDRRASVSGRRTGARHPAHIPDRGRPEVSARTVKMSLGSIVGGRAELIWPDEELLLCEGVETALSAWRIFRTPAWAICGGFPPELPLPQRVRSVQIIADHDAHGASERSAKVLAKSIRAGGRSCVVIMPNAPRADANDVLRGAA